MRTRITRRAAIVGGVTGAAGIAFAASLRDSDASTEERIEAREETRDLAPRTIVTRSTWGANEALRKDSPTYDSRVEKIVVHHTGTRNDAPDWATEIRQIYEFETANGYNDMSYNWLVDPLGVIYEGRWARDYPPGTPPDGESGGAKQVQGGHTKEHNRRTIGIALLGDFTDVAPTPAASTALRILLVWKCARWHIDAAGTGKYKLDQGGTEVLPNVFGHKRVRETECPGANLELLIPGLCEQVSLQLSS
ncbi:MAG: N-acetylmuramoyl-L-alanine amidase [Actinomycetota bacterium]|nr:N-acetylmuramoyl-L-alanine amidase [Actinomycetota bacterium]